MTPDQVGSAESVAAPRREPPLPPVASDRFRHVIGHLAGGVTVVTARDGEERHGLTASSVTSLSLDPPTLLCCLNRRSNTGQAVARSGSFAVNILEEGQVELAERFALNLPSPEKFVDVALLEDPSAQPLLVDALAHLVCRVRETIDGGTHFIFLADVVKAETRPGRPLAYYRGAFGHFALEEDISVRERLREAVVGGALETGSTLDLGELADSLGAPTTALHHALRELVAEGLLRRDPTAGFILANPSEHEADRARARVALELGALELGSLEPPPADGSPWEPALHALTAAEAAAAEGVLEARVLHQAVHTNLVALARSPALAEAHRRLSPAPAAIGQLAPPLQLLGELLTLDRQALGAAIDGDHQAIAGALAAHLALEGAAVLGASEPIAPGSLGREG